MKNIAVVGCGYWGKNLVRNFYELGALFAVCDPVIDVAQKFSQLYQAKAMSWEAILESKDISGVVLAVPASLHCKMCCEAIAACKDVYVEKPLALTQEEGVRIKDALTNSSQILLVGHLLQYHPAIEKTKEIINNKEIGTLKSIRSHRFNFGKIRHEENVLWSFAPHDLSVIHSLANSNLKTLNCVGQRFFNDDIHDRVDITMEFESGLHAEVCVSWIHPFKEQRLVVIGTNGMLVFDDTLQSFDEKLKLYRHAYARNCKSILQNSSEFEVIKLQNIEPLKSECAHFLQCIKTRQQPKTNIDEGMAVVKLLQMAQQELYLK